MSSSGIVNILSSSAKSFGTGFFVSPDGYILTCKHVLVEAGYTKIGQLIVFKYANHSDFYEAEWIVSPKTEDLAILHTSEHSDNYIPICHRDVTGSKVESYGFPNSSTFAIKACVSVDNTFDDEKYLQLGNANSVTYGFSGAPVICDGAAVGIITSVTKTDSNARLTEIALATSAKHLMQLFPKYVVKKEICVGYGDKVDKCNNYAISRNVSLCKECYKAQYLDAVQALYTAQNYHIHPFESYFVAELKYGASTYFDVVFTIVKHDEQVLPSDVYPLIDRAQNCKYHISQVFIVTNTSLSEDCVKLVNEHKIRIITKDELIRYLFDFIPYRDDLLYHANSQQLASHYIEVSCIDSLYEKESRIDAIYDDGRIGGADHSAQDGVYDLNSENEIIDDIVLNDEPTKFLKDYVNDFLSNNHRALLILGDYGSGKTSFCYTYALELLEKYIKGKANFLPILIRLRSYNKAISITQLLTDYFVNKLGINNFNIPSLKLLLKNLNVLFIFDGYDEVAKKVDFDVKYDVLNEICSLAEERTKIILTCRPNYFQNASEFSRIFQRSHFPYEPGEKPLIEFVETSIAGLNPEQIVRYIDSYQSMLEKTGLSVSDVLDTIANTHDLTDLAKRPFLLYMILNTLPKMIIEGNNDKGIKINAAKLYSVYTDNWIRREEDKNKTLIKQEDKELFCKEIALELYLSNSVSLSYKDFPSTIKNHFKYIERIEDVDYFTHDIQSCSFLTSDRSGDFAFIHKSFMEYFVADRIIAKLITDVVHKRGNKPTQNIDTILGITYLSMEICLFINDILNLQDTDIFEDTIQYFEGINAVSKSNFLSILAKTDRSLSDFLYEHKESIEDLSHVDFSMAFFSEGVLENLSFANIEFYSVNFSSIRFINCTFSGAAFNGCYLKGVDFINCQFQASKWKDNSLLLCTFISSDMFLYHLMEGDCINESKSSSWKYSDSQYCDSRNIKEEKLLNSYHDFEYSSWSDSDSRCFGFSEYEDGPISNCCDFEFSIWSDTSVESCSFYDCSFIESRMSRMQISDSYFNSVDFSGIDFSDGIDFRGNGFDKVFGEPYEL